MSNSNTDMPAAIVAAALLLSGAIIFYAVAISNADWFGPAMLFIPFAAVLLPWFLNGRKIADDTEEGHPSKNISGEREVSYPSSGITRSGRNGEITVKMDRRKGRKIKFPD